ncbi:MAG TPA: SWIM zinc finger family protein [Pyrinomonadaceae bacterium]|nr:SWIM zinc finger family protein [Pyrinomonadaceae bacterium]
MTATLIELARDTALLHELAGERSYERGENYAAESYVHSITEYKGKLVAIVTGTHDYQVKLWVERNELEYSCTCPMGEMGEFCKHCVATALVWAGEAESADEKRSGRKTGRSSTAAGRRAGTLDDAREAIARIGKIGALMEQAGHVAEFSEYVIGLRLRHKPKRNFIKLLAQY